MEGQETIQLYIGDRQSSLARPWKELKGFEKVRLAPGETRTIAFTLDERAFAFYDPARSAWITEPGEFEVLLGSSSSDIRLKANLCPGVTGSPLQVPPTLIPLSMSMEYSKDLWQDPSTSLGWP